MLAHTEFDVAVLALATHDCARGVRASFSSGRKILFHPLGFDFGLRYTHDAAFRAAPGCEVRIMCRAALVKRRPIMVGGVKRLTLMSRWILKRERGERHAVPRDRPGFQFENRD